METFFVVLIAIALLIWLISHLSNTGERLGRLESEITALKRELGQARQPGEAPAEPPPLPRPTAPAPPPPVPIQPSLIGDPTLSDRRPDPVGSANSPSSIATPAPKPVPRAAPSPPPLPRPVPRPEPAFDWRGMLRRVNLLPPGGENAEAAIGAWWLTRIGLVVLIIAAVFFGVRMAQDVPPWVRLSILFGVAGGMAALGLWLERRLPAFGRLISAGGLALGYFAAFAAYGIPATKVIADPALGFLVQTLAVAGVIGWSLWKRDEMAAAMAMLLGLVACWFSHWHDLDQFTIAGLLTLAAGGGVLLVSRQWRWPYGVTLVGSWFGFLVLAVRDWPPPGDTPASLIVLGSLLLLTALLEAANFLAEQRSGDRARWRHWLAVINTSLAVGVGWLAVRLAYPPGLETTEIDAFYLSFAVLMGVFAALRFWKKHGAGLTETYFLKSAGLLALFVVAHYDGPTRWLSLAVQTVILLYAWRRSGLRWIEVGFWVLLAASTVLIWHDTLQSAGVAWSAFSVRNIVGTLSLALLAAALGLHGRWSAGAALAPLRIIGALAIGAAALPLVLGPWAEEGMELQRIATLSVIALGIGAPAFALRQFSPVMAGLAALLPAFFLYVFDEREWSTASELGCAAWMVLLGLGLAEVALRLWRGEWHLGNGTRLILQGGALMVIAVATHRLAAHLNPGSLWLPTVLTLPYLAAALWALQRQSVTYPATHFSGDRRTARTTLWLLAAVAGLGLVVAHHHGLEDKNWWASWLAVGAGILFASAYLTKSHSAALAGGIPLLVAVLTHVFRFYEFSGSWTNHAGAAAMVMAVCWGTAFVVGRRFRDNPMTATAGAYDLVLHLAAFLTLHWFFRTHLDLPGVFLADALTALAAVGVARYLPLPSLVPASFLPLLLAILHRGVAESLTDPVRGESPLWWLAMAAIFGWIWLKHRAFVAPAHRLYSDGSRSLIGGVLSGLGTAVLILAAQHAAAVPWHLVATAAAGLALAALGRWGKIPSTAAWSYVPLGLAAIQSIGYLLDDTGPPPTTLAAICLVAAMIVAHGIVATWRWPREKRSLTWLHALTALLALAFPAFEQNRLGVDSLTTVCWGASAIVLFVAGFATALRPYRLAGLIGLAIAIVRLFVVDIDDPLYRIYAFFGIAVVLLGMGYLYHRFRHLIERADRHLSGETVDAPPDPADE